jgi:glycosyltransferase involved in cell wall biosynthesis
VAPGNPAPAPNAKPRSPRIARLTTSQPQLLQAGSAFNRLKELAEGATNISFTDWLPEIRLREIVAKAEAAIYVPIDEDFGLSSVEAMAAGKPGVGVAEGGLPQTVVDGETGVFIFVSEAKNKLYT